MADLITPFFPMDTSRLCGRMEKTREKRIMVVTGREIKVARRGSADEAVRTNDNRILREGRGWNETVVK